MQPIYAVGHEAHAASLVEIDIDFQSTSMPNTTWLLNGKRIGISSNTEKYLSFCEQNSALNYTCKLHILTFTESDAGFYTLELEISEHKIRNSINFTLIAPKKPELTILRPKDCSLNFTCEYNKNIEFICKSIAHDVDSILMSYLPCKNLEDCYSMKNNHEKIEEHISENIFLQTDLDGTQPIATFDLNLTAIQPYLIICTSSNEVGNTTRSVIMIPSDIKQGQTSAASFVNTERINDLEVVEGDDFRIRFDFVYQIFDKNTLKYAKPNVHCLYSVFENNTDFTLSHILTFKNVTQMCTHVYSFEINSKKHAYLNDTLRRNSINITVLKPQLPGFVHAFSLSNNLSNNLTNLSFKEISPNNYQIVSDGDQTLTLDCRSYGKPKPTVTWLRNGSQFDTEDEKFKELDNRQQLRILRPHSSDSGLYECIVNNRVGAAKRSFDIEVRTQVIISKKLTTKQKAFIGTISVCAGILLILFLLAIVYVVHQKRLNDSLKVY